MSGNSNVEILRGNPKKAINKLAYPIIGSLLLVMLNNKYKINMNRYIEFLPLHKCI